MQSQIPSSASRAVWRINISMHHVCFSNVAAGVSYDPVSKHVSAKDNETDDEETERGPSEVDLIRVP